MSAIIVPELATATSEAEITPFAFPSIDTEVPEIEPSTLPAAKTETELPTTLPLIWPSISISP